MTASVRTCFHAISLMLVFVFAQQLSLNSHAQPLVGAKYIAGEDYEILDKPLKLASAGKVEVMEIFWYGCGHCYTFEPLVREWKKTIKDDVAFMRTPAIWQPVMRAHAALYYVADALELPQEVHTDLFVMLTKEPRLEDTQRFAAVFQNYGVEKDTFLKLYDSFAVKAKVKQGENRIRKNYKTKGTPEIVVNGKYRVTTRAPGGPNSIFAVIDYLVQLERDQMAADQQG